MISTKIRETVKKNALDLINQFNLALAEVRADIRRNHVGQDLLFIVDGSERISYETYEQLFVKDSYLLRGIDASIINSVRIDSFYRVAIAQQIAFFQPVILPMIHLPSLPGSEDRMKQIITKRIAESHFFEKGVLEYFVQLSGGCIRQLLRIVNRAILYTRGEKISQTDAEQVADILSREMMQTLAGSILKFSKRKTGRNPPTRR